MRAVYKRQEIDLNRIQRVAIFKTRQDGIQCVATIDGQKLQPRSVTTQQWQRLWVAEDRDGYKRHLAATLFADVLQKGQSVGEQKAEEQVRQQNEKMFIRDRLCGRGEADHRQKRGAYRERCRCGRIRHGYHCRHGGRRA